MMLPNCYRAVEDAVAAKVARAECEQCQGRVYGDCDALCRYFWLTASRAEREDELRRLEDTQVRTVRGWTGPVERDLVRLARRLNSIRNRKPR